MDFKNILILLIIFIIIISFNLFLLLNVPLFIIYSVFIPLVIILLSFLIVLIILKIKNSQICYKIPFFDDEYDYNEIRNFTTDDDEFIIKV